MDNRDTGTRRTHLLSRRVTYTIRRTRWAGNHWHTVLLSRCQTQLLDRGSRFYLENSHSISLIYFVVLAVRPQASGLSLFSQTAEVVTSTLPCMLPLLTEYIVALSRASNIIPKCNVNSYCRRWCDLYTGGDQMTTGIQSSCFFWTALFLVTSFFKIYLSISLVCMGTR